MSKRKKSVNTVTAQKPATSGAFASDPVPAAAADSAAPGWHRSFFIVGTCTLAMLLGWVLFVALRDNGERPEPDKRKEAEYQRDPRQEQMTAALAKALKSLPQREPWKAEPWKPDGDDDKLIDRFVKLQQAGDAAARGLLAPVRRDDVPVSEDEYERRAAGYFLRQPKVKVTDVWRGEPGAEGKPRPSAGKYMLVTKGTEPLPTLSVLGKGGKPRVTSGTLHNPVVVVEVRDGKIHPLRTE